MLVPPATHCTIDIQGEVVEAVRVDHHVPIFRLSIECTHGLPATDVPVGGGDPVADSSLLHSDHALGAGGAEEGVSSSHPEGGSPLPLPSDPAPGAGGGDRGDEGHQEISGDQGEEGLEREQDESGIHHLMTHLPKSKTCDTCQQAKLLEAQHRRHQNMNERLREAREKEKPTHYLEKISIDHIVSRDEIGNRGEQYTLVIVDQFSGFVSLFPCMTKSAEEVETALRRMVGKKRPGVVQVASDRAPELRKALDSLGFAKEPAAPNQRLHNPIAESMVRNVKGMTTSILLHAGVEPQYWPLAQKYLEWAFNVSTPAVGEWDDDGPAPTRYEVAMGYPIESFMVPFGALVWYKNPDVTTYSPKGEASLFLGAELTDGMLFKGCYRVWPLDAFLEGVCKEVVTRSIAIPVGDWRFPAKTKDKTAPADDFEYEPSILEDNPADEPIFDDIVEEEQDLFGEEEKDSSVPDKGIKIRRGKITELRIASYGKTPGCEGCRTGISTAHTQACRDRFDELLEGEPVRRRKTAEPKPAKDIIWSLSILVELSSRSCGVQRGNHV